MVMTRKQTEYNILVIMLPVKYLRVKNHFSDIHFSFVTNHKNKSDMLLIYDDCPF